MDEKKLEKFCNDFDCDCNDFDCGCNYCPYQRRECDDYYAKYHELPMSRYKGNDNG